MRAVVLALSAVAALLAPRALAEPAAPAAAEPVDPVVTELRARRAQAVAELQRLETIYERLDALSDAARRLEGLTQPPLETGQAREPCRGLRRDVQPAMPNDRGDGTIEVRTSETLRGPVSALLCALRAVAGGARLTQISDLALRSTADGAVAELTTIEWRVAPRPERPRPKPTSVKPLAAGASPEARMLARELELLRVKQDRLAELEARRAMLESRVAALTLVRDQVAAASWHVSALTALAEHPPIGLGLELTPRSGRVSGELVDASERAALQGLMTPPGVIWDLSGLRAPRADRVELPVVLDAGAEVRVDAYEAPAFALAVSLGAQLVARPAPEARFTGRISAGDRVAALAALRGAVPALAAVKFRPEPATGERVSIRVIDADSAQLIALLEQVAGREMGTCAVPLSLSVGVKNAPVDAVIAAVEAVFAAEPRCEGAAAQPPPVDDAEPDRPLIDPAWRLVATVRRGPEGKLERTGIFADADGLSRPVSDMSGGWDRVFAHFAPGRVVSLERVIFLLGPEG